MEGIETQLIEMAGLSGEAADTLLGRIMAMPQPQRAKTFQKVLATQKGNVAQVTPEGRSRAEMLRKSSLLPKEIQAGLASNRLQLVDVQLYVVKPALTTAGQVKMFKDTDDKEIGVSNVSKGQLDTDKFFLLESVQVLSGVDATNPKGQGAPWDVASAPILNGEFQFKAAGKAIVPDQSSMGIFLTSGRTDVRRGEYKLDNPKLIEPSKAMEFNIDQATGAAANTFIRLNLNGTIVLPW